ncbi:hypothetical protein KR044_009980, partial [Drosophila immigrans]
FYIHTLINFYFQQLQTNAQNATVDLSRSQAVIDTVKLMLDEKLPPNAEAAENANMLWESVKTSLKICDENAKKDLQVVNYNKCVDETKVWAVASVGELAGQSWAKSGASRPGLFC